MNEKMHGQMLINGQFIGGESNQLIGKVEIRSPWDGRIIGTATEGSVQDLKTAIDSAQSAFLGWRKSARYERQILLRNIARKCNEEREYLAQLLVDEIGKPVIYARGEVDRLIKTFELTADALFHWGIKALPGDLEERGIGYRITEERFPLGPILAMTPYNWPYNLAAHKIAPAIAVGSTVVVKPSPKSLLSSYALGRLIHEAGSPPGIVSFVDAPISAFPEILSHKSLRVLSFTGSSKVGWNLKSQCPPQMKVALELGGNAFAVVCNDADIDRAISRILPATIAYAGQICISIQHILVQNDIYKIFKEKLISGLEKVQFGDPSREGVICGPLIDDQAADRIENWIKDVQNCDIHCFGKRTNRLIPPTIVETKDRNRPLPGISEELFGPIATLSSFQTIEEAISIVQSSPFGIQMGIFCKESSVAERFYREIEIGGVIINDAPNFRLDWFSYGGEKQSGFGREGVTYAMDEFSYPKSRVERMT